MLLPGGARFADFESWSAARANHQDLLARLAAHDPVVVLSGDVHYGFTPQLTRSEAGGTTQVAQLTSSAAKNVEIKNAAISLFSELDHASRLERSGRPRGSRRAEPERTKLLRPHRPGRCWLGRHRRRAAGPGGPRGGSEPTALATPVARPTGWPTPDGPTWSSPSTTRWPTSPPRPWTHLGRWDPDKSLVMAAALQEADLERFARMFVGLPQLAVVTFPSPAVG